MRLRLELEFHTYMNYLDRLTEPWNMFIADYVFPWYKVHGLIITGEIYSFFTAQKLEKYPHIWLKRENTAFKKRKKKENMEKFMPSFGIVNLRIKVFWSPLGYAQNFLDLFWILHIMWECEALFQRCTNLIWCDSRTKSGPLYTIILGHELVIIEKTWKFFLFL